MRSMNIGLIEPIGRESEGSFEKTCYVGEGLIQAENGECKRRKKEIGSE